MPGRFSLYPDLSVAENLGFFASLFGTTVAAARATIAPIWVQLEQFSSRRAGALSGGMKQKLALCCALVHRPEILFLDEPTTGVDAVSRREFWELLGRLRDEGLPIIVSTPYMDEAARCDRVSLMQSGKLLITDRPLEIERQYPRPLLAVRGPDALGLLAALRRFPHSAAVWPFGETLHYTDRRADMAPDAVARDLSAYAISLGLMDVSCRPIPATIEDSFMWYMVESSAT
jgi:ABC-type multidrug transport system ATPase subunit